MISDLSFRIGTRKFDGASEPKTRKVRWYPARRPTLLSQAVSVTGGDQDRTVRPSTSSTRSTTFSSGAGVVLGNAGYRSRRSPAAGTGEPAASVPDSRVSFSGSSSCGFPWTRTRFRTSRAVIASTVSKTCGVSSWPGTLWARSPTGTWTVAPALQRVREHGGGGHAGVEPVVEHGRQAPDRVPLPGGPQVGLVGDPLLVEGEDVAQDGPQLEQRDAVVVAAGGRSSAPAAAAPGPRARASSASTSGMAWSMACRKAA